MQVQAVTYPILTGGDLEEYEEVAQEIYDALVDIAEKSQICKVKSDMKILR